MLRYLVRRLLLLIPILFGVSLLIFFWIRALPGGPAESLLGERATPQLVEEYRHRYGLDRPVYVQYWAYLKTTLSGDLGVSIADRRRVTYDIRQRFPATVELAIAAMVFAIAVGVPLGFLAAKRYGGFFDNFSLVFSLIGISIPIFFLAIILKYIFAIRLGWLPSVGRESITSEAQHPTNFYILDAIIERDWAALGDTIKHLILPAIALGSIPLAIIMRITRASVLDVQNEDYVRTARAKGLPPATVDRRHVFRNALLPVTTIIGLQTGLLLSGAVLTETVFAFPGMGSWLRDAIFNRDYPVLQGGILFLAIVFVLVNLIVDVSYAFINPRIRYS
ncbi:MAG TPA: ABC transporter permease [Gaiellaceae bacterium]